MEFSIPWERIKKETSISNYTELATFLKITPQAVAQKAKKDFPIKWAFEIAQRYNLSTDWIMTGKTQEILRKNKKETKIIQELEEWLSELIKKDPRKEIWFEVAIEDAFKDFAEWKQEKKEQDNQDKKVAA